ncbi:coadhesin-like isoform X2 [Dreissena polymorpha]|uniref:coadhesin-like isoform X2 n=1 Tax=Dreissena polymorpha TaxID=45954 RepID=UPI00226437BF|nr:coadhesin-like isoform X2 [Dreissena polymorpha]
MMYRQFISLYLMCLLLGINLRCSEGKFSCFKQYRPKKDTCGGLISRDAITSPQECCTEKDRGFSMTTATKLGKNQYSCTSCKDFLRPTDRPDSTTAKPKENFVCYRKFRTKNGECGGPIKKAKFSTPEACCRGTGQGFSVQGLDKVGDNRYTCISCIDWKNGANLTTPAPATTPEPPAEWSHWSPCDVTCGTGTRTRHRMCKNCDVNHHSNREFKSCLVNFYCPEAGGWGSWFPWERCSQECDGGFRRRERRCDNPPPRHGGETCPGKEEEDEQCNTHECDVQGGWSEWTRFGACSHTCGRGEMLRLRGCTSPAPRGKGSHCVGLRVEARRCEERKCPIHGGWSDWSAWSSCPVTCGEGRRFRSRECNRPVPDFRGRPCEGSSEETEPCRLDNDCPVDGGWSDWSYYGPCRAGPCQAGHRLRTRECDNPRPRHPGRVCVGRSLEKIACMNDEGCPVDGGWCDYGLWTECSATCKGTTSVQHRTRACYCPPPQNGGKFCAGDFLETIQCEGHMDCGETPDVVVGS